MAETEQFDKKLARELLLTAKVYRGMAFVMLALGIFMFGLLYYRYFNADAMQAVQDPIIIVFITVPFLPAFLLARKAKKAEKALSKLVSTDE